MKTLSALAALLLAGCATTHAVDLRPALVGCLEQGKLLGAVEVDSEGHVTGAACLAVRLQGKGASWTGS